MDRTRKQVQTKDWTLVYVWGGKTAATTLNRIITGQSTAISTITCKGYTIVIVAIKIEMDLAASDLTHRLNKQPLNICTPILFHAINDAQLLFYVITQRE